MDITEDEEIYIQNDYIPPKKPEVKPEEPPETKKEEPEIKKDTSNPGTRIIYQAPEGGEKRKFTGFKDLMDDEKNGDISDIEEEEIDLTDKPSPAPRKNAQAFRQSVRARYSNSFIKPDEVEEEEVEIDESEKKTADGDVIIDEEVDEIIIGDNDDKPPVKRGAGEKIRKIVLALSIIVMIVSAGFIANHFIQIERNKQWEGEMSNLTLPDINPVW